MPSLELWVGSPRLSSWSLRPYVALHQTGAPFTVEVIALDTPGTKARLALRSPSGKVPVLRDGELWVWDSLAICEYLAERFPEAGLWPATREARAHARALCAEMHAGFGALRQTLPFAITETRPTPPLGEAVRDDLRRLEAAWTDALERHGRSGGGPFLFGAPSIADAFFAPVVSRFRTYGLPFAEPVRAWADAVWGLPAVQAWRALAQKEA